jgi:CheY-like chemotaxis protein
VPVDNQPTQLEAPAARLRPERVLVLSCEHAFRAVITLLLSRRGCSATATGSAGRLVELAGRERPDVVLVDVGGSAAAFRRAAGTIEALPRSVGVVVVADQAFAAPNGVPVLARWAPFPELFAAIQLAGRRRSR